MPEADRHSLLVVIGDLDVGGAESHLALVLPRLRDQGFRPMVYALTHRGSLADVMESEGVPVFTVPGSAKLKSLPSLLRKPLMLLLTSLRLWWLMLRTRPELVHFFLPSAYLIGGLCALAAGMRPTLMSRRSRNHYQQRYPLLAPIEHWLHRRMDRVVGNSLKVIADLKSESIPQDRLRLLYNGIDIERWNAAPDRTEARGELGIGDGVLVLIMVANLIPYKGHADLLQALGKVRERMPDDWLLLCVGRDQGIRHRLERQAKSIGIADQVRFLGQREDAERLFAAADIGLLVSHEEGFSNSLLEAMACGLPMIVTDVGGNDEVVEEGVSGFVVPSRSPKDLGEAIVRLASHPERRTMGSRGQERIRRDYSIDRCVAQYRALYEELIGVGKTRAEGS